MSKLKTLRKKVGLTQAGLSEETGLSQQYISDLETGQSDGSINSLRKISKVLGVHISRLIEDDNLENNSELVKSNSSSNQ